MKKHYIKPAKFSSKCGVLLLLAGLAGIGNAKAQFSGIYSPSNWTFTQDAGMFGSVNTSGAPSSIQIQSSNDNTPDHPDLAGNTIYQKTIPYTGTISFDWSYNTVDGAGGDYPLYSINGVIHQLSTYDLNALINTQSGTQSGISVNAGDVFALIMHTTDNSGGPATTVFSNFSGPLAPLDITLTNIAATAVNGKNLVTWNTAKEDRGDYFELERSANGKDFVVIKTIKANEKPGEYSYTDATPLSGINYYRLNMKDVAGNGHYSKVVTAQNQSNTQQPVTIKAFPNPAVDYVTVNINDAQAAGQLYVIDIAGKTVQSAVATGLNTTLNTTELPAGLYTIMYKAGANMVSTQLVKR